MSKVALFLENPRREGFLGQGGIGQGLCLGKPPWGTAGKERTGVDLSGMSETGMTDSCGRMPKRSVTRM